MSSKPPLTQNEEDCLKEIFLLSGEKHETVLTNTLAKKMDAHSSSITVMMDALALKKLISYKKYNGCTLTNKGKEIAIQIIRRHRLWKTFLCSKLSFDWSEVSEAVSQLKYAKSDKLIDSIDEFLGQPKFDPHGDPIPDKKGVIAYNKTKRILVDTSVNSWVEVVSVNEESISLLKYLDSINISIGSVMKVCNRYPFDESLQIEISGKKLGISKKVAECIGVKISEKK